MPGGVGATPRFWRPPASRRRSGPHVLAEVLGVVGEQDPKSVGFGERAWKRASAFCDGIPRDDTVRIMVALVKANVLTIAEKDREHRREIEAEIRVRQPAVTCRACGQRANCQQAAS